MPRSNRTLSAGGRRGNWAKKDGKKDAKKDPKAGAKGDAPTYDAGLPRQRLIIFVLGAVGYNELKVAYDLSVQNPQLDVFIGAPRAFVLPAGLGDDSTGA